MDNHDLKVLSEPDAECLWRPEPVTERRSLIAWLMGVSTMIAASIVGAPLFRFVSYPMQSNSQGEQWTPVGKVGEFQGSGAPIVKIISITRRDGWRRTVTSQPVYISRGADGKLQVYSPICPHLGCSVAWHDERKRFICPCHGGQFGADGQRISGPPPRRLDALEARVENGVLLVQFEYFRSNVPNRELLN